jgi:tRNA1Val (adenine37-N6)-methyltransferase
MSIFKFKQFEVDQSGCAMRINTDGVLLAAMVQSDRPKNILDIGTGTGVIALMLAQRFIAAQLTAVEIDATAAATAGRNFSSSAFKDRLEVVHAPIQQFNSVKEFDLIVSNPPYFVNDLKNTEEKKGIARHTDAAFFEDLISKVNLLLSENGSFWCVLPIKQAEDLIVKAEGFNLKPHTIIHLHSDKTKKPFRQIVCLQRTNKPAQTSSFYIYEAEKVYTTAYKKLLEDFFLGY